MRLSAIICALLSAMIIGATAVVALSPQWSADDNWGVCNQACGGGKQLRNVNCLDTDNNGSKLHRSACVAKRLPQPAIEQSCNTQPCTKDQDPTPEVIVPPHVAKHVSDRLAALAEKKRLAKLKADADAAAKAAAAAAKAAADAAAKAKRTGSLTDIVAAAKAKKKATKASKSAKKAKGKSKTAKAAASKKKGKGKKKSANKKKGKKKSAKKKDKKKAKKKSADKKKKKKSKKSANKKKKDKKKAKKKDKKKEIC